VEEKGTREKICLVIHFLFFFKLVNSCDRSKAFLSVSPRRPAVTPFHLFSFFDLFFFLEPTILKQKLIFHQPNPNELCVTLESNHYDQLFICQNVAPPTPITFDTVSPSFHRKRNWSEKKTTNIIPLISLNISSSQVTSSHK
jgi:hypothetical protein